jgi:hypothetical protein
MKLSKVELKKQLQAMGVKVEGNYVHRKDLEKVLSTTRDLHCDMKEDCDQPVTHIDEKGWVYCEQHGKSRKQSMRCRKLTQQELKKLEKGEPLSSY